MLRTEPVKHIRISPDGEHGKRFDFRSWFGRQGFILVAPNGATSDVGPYEDESGRVLTISLRPGFSNVAVELENGAKIATKRKCGMVYSEYVVT